MHEDRFLFEGIEDEEVFGDEQTISHADEMLVVGDPAKMRVF